MAEFDMKITDNSEAVLNNLDQAIDRALKKCGVSAVSYAAQITPVVTGLARNSITWALHGQEADKASYKASVGDGEGEYSGTAPDKKNTVFIGSNVEYFPFLEEGGTGNKGGWHMLRKAITEHGDQYKKFLEDELKATQD